MPAVAEGSVFKLDDLRAPAESTPFEFEFGGARFSLPAVLDVRARLLLDAAGDGDGKAEQALRVMLGAEQWDRLLAVPDVLDVRMLHGLMEAYGRHLCQPLTVVEVP